MPVEKLLVTGATGMVGSFVARRAVELGYEVRVLMRRNADDALLYGLDVERAYGDLGDYESLLPALAGADIVVHAGAHIGDWGPAEIYRAINVVGLEHMLTAVEREGRIRRWIQISSLGVYEARDHYGTDETTPPDLAGLDGYTRTKAEAEVLLNHHIQQRRLPAVILRPGFIYGPGDRHVLPRMIKKFESGVIKFIGDGQALLNNIHVQNLVDAVFLAVEKDRAVGQTYNIRDERLVTREEYLMTVANYLGRPRPKRIPLGLARIVAPLMEGFAKLRGAKEPPLLTGATIKFMALHLDFSIEKAKRELSYRPRVDFQEGLLEALDWATGKMRPEDLAKVAGAVRTP